MLIRKIALLAPAFATVFGASQVEAGCFGKRNCCQATPIVCPPCAPPAQVFTTPTVQYQAARYYPSCPQPCGQAIVQSCGAADSGSSGATVTMSSSSLDVLLNAVNNHEQRLLNGGL